LKQGRWNSAEGRWSSAEEQERWRSAEEPEALEKRWGRWTTA